MSKKGGSGGGVIANPKISLQIYTYLQISGKKAQCNFQKGRGEVKAIWTFSKKTFIFGETVVPKMAIAKMNDCVRNERHCLTNVPYLLINLRGRGDPEPLVGLLPKKKDRYFWTGTGGC